MLYFSDARPRVRGEARTGRIWHYTWPETGGLTSAIAASPCSATVYFVTPTAISSRSTSRPGEKWFKEICSLEMMYYGSVAPVVVKDKLIVGASGDDLDQPALSRGTRPHDGELIWRWYVTPQNAGDPGLETWPNLDMAKQGGGMTWQPVTYDPELI